MSVGFGVGFCVGVLSDAGSESAKGEEREENGRIDITIAAIMAERIHLFPFRTQKLSFLTPKVLCGTPLGRIGHRRFSFALLSKTG